MQIFTVSFNFNFYRLDFRASQSAKGSYTIIGKDTIILNEVSPGVVMDGFAAASKFFSAASASKAKMSSTAASASTAAASSATGIANRKLAAKKPTISE